MRRLIERVMFGLSMAVFGLVVLAALPFVLPQFAGRYARSRIEAKWPDSDRARRVGKGICHGVGEVTRTAAGITETQRPGRGIKSVRKKWRDTRKGGCGGASSLFAPRKVWLPTREAGHPWEEGPAFRGAKSDDAHAGIIVFARSD